MDHSHFTEEAITVGEYRWYALHIRCQHEKKVASSLQRDGFTTFLPLLHEVHRWSDRLKRVQVPLFPCYVFLRCRHSPEIRMVLLRTPGVLSIVGCHGAGDPIPDDEIDAIRAVVAQKVALEPYPFIALGERIRIVGGALDGIEGIIVRREGNRRLIISVTTIERSLAISLEGFCVQPVSAQRWPQLSLWAHDEGRT
jgi:transcription antitermination factor NusG